MLNGKVDLFKYWFLPKDCRDLLSRYVAPREEVAVAKQIPIKGNEATIDVTPTLRTTLNILFVLSTFLDTISIGAIIRPTIIALKPFQGTVIVIVLSRLDERSCTKAGWSTSRATIGRDHA